MPLPFLKQIQNHDQDTIINLQGYLRLLIHFVGASDENAVVDTGVIQHCLLVGEHVLLPRWGFLDKFSVTYRAGFSVKIWCVPAVSPLFPQAMGK